MKSLRVLVVAVVGGALALPAGPAAAQSASFADAANDVVGVPYLDLQAVNVKNTKKAITVTYSSRSLGNISGSEVVLLDTDPRRPGPELQVGFGRYSESWVTPMRKWKADRSKAAKRKYNPNPYGKAGTCDRTVRVNSRWQRGFTPVTVTVRKKKGCITSKRVRVHLATATDGYHDLTRYDRFGSVLRDSLPNGTKSFTGWVKQRSVKAKPRRFVDGRDTIAWWSDVRSVAVGHTADRLTVTVRHLARSVYRSGGLVEVHLDTNGDGVPNFLVSLGRDGAKIRAATGWGQYGAPLACSIDGGLGGVGLSTSAFSMPTAPCLGDPATIRVAVSAQDRTTSTYTPTDWLGGARAWSAPVAKG